MGFDGESRCRVEADRQIERMKLRVQRQAVHTENLELDNFQPEAKRAHTVLNRLLAELTSPASAVAMIAVGSLFAIIVLAVRWPRVALREAVDTAYNS